MWIVYYREHFFLNESETQAGGLCFLSVSLLIDSIRVLVV